MVWEAAWGWDNALMLAMWMEPPVGRVFPAMVERIVDGPELEWPSRQRTSPGRILWSFGKKSALFRMNE